MKVPVVTLDSSVMGTSVSPPFFTSLLTKTEYGLVQKVTHCFSTFCYVAATAVNSWNATTFARSILCAVACVKW